jgi:hypothetical protein
MVILCGRCVVRTRLVNAESSIRKMGLGQFFEFEDSIHNPRFLDVQIVGYGTQDSKNCGF